MMRAWALSMAMLLAGVGAQAATLNPTVSVAPGSVNAGDAMTVVVQVTNQSSYQMLNVSTSVQAYGAGSASAALVATPVPFSAPPVAASSSASFTWVFNSSGCGSVYFSASASAYNTGSGVTETAGPVDSGPIPVNCVTGTLSPTSSPTPTATPTNWIVYATPTPAPLFGDASIPGNIFHPDRGQPLQLRFSAPLEGTVQIDLYNRIGGHVRHFELNVNAGSYTQPWDGRDEQGLLVASGIYVAQFKAKGLFKAVKFAVVK
jgi:hypothetical protein